MQLDDSPDREDGQPYWWIASPRPEPESKSPPARIDVLVVGSGYTGASAALTLARAGRQVLIVDKRRAGEGASSRNGGICSGNLKHSLADLTGRFGRDRALAIYREGVVARTYLGDLIRREKIDCDYAMTGRFTGVSHPRHIDGVKRNVEMLNEELGVSAWFVEKQDVGEELGTGVFHGGYVRDDIGGLHPGRFQLGLLGAAERAGASFRGGVAVLGVTADGRRHRVETSAGTIVADHVIAATNGYSDGFLPWLQRRVVPIPSQLIATAPVSPNLMKQLMPRGRMCGETNRLFTYYRPSPDGRRMLFGGRVLSESADPVERGGHLREKMIAMFPELGDTPIERSWFGYTGFTMDFLPKIGVRDGIHYACGYCGSGVVWATFLGHKVALQVLGVPEGGSAFDGIPFRAVPFYNGNPWFLGAMVRWYGLCDSLGR